MKIKQEIKKWKNFMIACIVLAIFFVLPQIHDWANSTLVKLHFCDHFYCMIFAAIFVVMAFWAWKKKKSYVKIGLIILGVGIILMNITYCENGNMFLGGFSFGSFTIFSPSGDECKPGENCTVLIPPCDDSDAGRDYITYGTILSGTYVDDICMGNILRERYCNSDLTYTSEDIDCPSTFGAGWICEEGECREGTPVVIDEPVIGNETDCGDGIDNDGDGLIDCADPDCDYPFEEGGCGDFEYSCLHLSEYPTCGGTCPSGSICGIYNVGDGTLDGGWCECIPEGVTSCYDSADCTGWCDEEEMEVCIGDDDGCYCEWIFNIDTCTDTDWGIYPLVGGVVGYAPLSFPDYCVYKTNRLVENYCNIDGFPATQEFDCEDTGLCCIEDITFGSYCGECPPLEF